MNINDPIPAEWGSYVTQSNVGLEVIPGMLYSTKNYVSGTTVQLTLFDFVNQSRRDLTNMKQPSMLPNPMAMLIQNIRVFFWNDVQSDDSGEADASDLVSGFNDVVALSRGILDLTIGEKQYGPFPLWTLPAHNFVKGAFSTGSDLAGDYGQVDGMLYSLFPNLMISPLQQFLVTLSWPAGAVTLSIDELPVEVLFDGQIARAIQ